jgi:hypothetical protein
MAYRLDEIADALADYRWAKNQLKDCKGRLVEMAVELGMDQQAAISGYPQDFLDGYLVANGMMQKHREKEQ